jgi:hypothetical protein
MSVLSCERCGKAYGAADVNVQLGLATCRGCDTVYQLSPPAVAPRPQRERGRLGIPEGWSEGTDGQGLLLRRRWRGPTAYFLLLFCLFWDGIVGVFWLGALGGALEQSGEVSEAPPIFFLLPHTLVGLGLTYVMLASLLNTTELRVGGGRLTVRHGPVPWWGSRDVPTAGLRQLFVSESSVRVNRRPTYNLCYLDDGSVARTLVSSLQTVAELRWAEQRIEERLEIKDEAVADEVG